MTETDFPANAQLNFRHACLMFSDPDPSMACAILGGAMISDVNDYFIKGCGRCERFDTPDCNALRWHAGLQELRRICLGTGLVETVKWGQPCYTLNGKNVAILGAFRRHFTLTFFKPSLMANAQGLMTKRGENSRTEGVIKFEDSAQVTQLEPALIAYLHEAIEIERKGLKPAKVQAAVELTATMIDVLDEDPALAEAFHALTPGRQRGYCIVVGSAKTAQTERNRMAKYRAKIIAGKGPNEY